jgi:hypothetical protein
MPKASYIVDTACGLYLAWFLVAVPVWLAAFVLYRHITRRLLAWAARPKPFPLGHVSQGTLTG